MTQHLESTLRSRLADLLVGHQAHAGFDSVVENFPPEDRGRRVEGLPYTAWQLLEHLRLALEDLLDYSRDPQHESPPWPAGYWPDALGPEDDAAWEASVAEVRRLLGEMSARVSDPAIDLAAPFAWAERHDLLREVLLAAEHNAYHLGQLVLLRRLLGNWPEE